MGSGSFTYASWSNYRKNKGITNSSSVHSLYKAKNLNDYLNPIGINPNTGEKETKNRESRDSDEHPASTPIILALDETGSMSEVLTTVSQKLNVLMKEIYTRKPVTDPQIMIVAFGDVKSDRCPLQVSQFESDIRIAEQLAMVYFEQCGGGNNGESYTLPWYYAARHTSTDAYEKHNKKGFLFTMGDENYHSILTKEEIQRFVGDTIPENLTAEELLTEVSRQYEVYHLMIEEGYSYDDKVRRRWADLIGERAIPVSDCTKIPEIIVSILEVMSGKDSDEVAASWDGSTAVVVKKAISGLSKIDSSSELVEF